MLILLITLISTIIGIIIGMILGLREIRKNVIMKPLDLTSPNIRIVTNFIQYLPKR